MKRSNKALRMNLMSTGKYTFLATLMLFICLSTVHAEENPDPRLKRAENLVKQLGANSYKDRKKAIKELIELGYFAKKAVQAALNSNDPEIKENAIAVWEKVRWMVTESNSQKVTAFIDKIKKGSANSSDWKTFVKETGADSLDVLMVIEDANLLNSERKAQPPEADPFADPFADDPFLDEGETNFSTPVLFKHITMLVAHKDLIKRTKTYSDAKKDRVLSYIKVTVENSSPFTQKKLLSLASGITDSQQLWSLYSSVDFSSPMVRSSLSENALNYVHKNLKTQSLADYYRALLVLFERKKLSSEDLNELVLNKNFANTPDDTARFFYMSLRESLTEKTKMKLLEKGSAPWRVFHKALLSNSWNHEKVKTLIRDNFSSCDDIVDFISAEFRASDSRVLPFYEVALELQTENDWTASYANYSLCSIYHSKGDYKKAHKAISEYNKTVEDVIFTNTDFYKEQNKLAKDETVKILSTVFELNGKEPAKALKLLNKAADINPDLLSVMIHKARAELTLGMNKEAVITIEKAIELMPKATVEADRLFQLCWDANAKSSALKLIKKLGFKGENYTASYLAGSTGEIFLDFNMAGEWRDKNGALQLYSVKELFYKGQFKEALSLLDDPEEEFNMIWGALAARAVGGEKKAKSFLNEFNFEEHWTEMLALAVAGDITPDELLTEAKADFSPESRAGKLTEAWFYMGCCYLFGDNKNIDKAKDYFNKAADLRHYLFIEYSAAKAMLNLIEQGKFK